MSCSRKLVVLGGASSMMINFRKELIQTLVELEFEVICFAEGYTDEQKAMIASWGAVAVESPLSSRGLNPFSDVLAVVKLRKFLKKNNINILFCFFAKPVIFGGLSAWLAKVPRVVGMIEGLGNAFTDHKEKTPKKTAIIKRVQVFLYKLSLPKLSHLIFLNQDDKSDLLETYRIKPKHVTVLGGIGLDLSQFSYHPVNTEEITFLFIGRLLKEKGVFDYLEAAEKVKKLYPKVKFYLLGGFDAENPFALKKNELEKHLNSGVVIYPGHVNNVPEWIVKSSVFVLPSYREGMPRSTQEAMAIGRPVITTDVPGCRDTVVNGVNGFLVPPFSPDKIIRKMLFFIEKPEKITEMGLRGYEMAKEKYDVHLVNKHLISLILGDE